MAKLNVVQYYWKFDPLNIGGVEAHIASLVHSLDKKVKYSIISTKLQGQREKETFFSAKVFRVGPNKVEGVNYANSLLDVYLNESAREKNKLAVFEKLDFDLIHLHGPVNYSNSVLGGPLFTFDYLKQSWLKQKKPKIMTFHGLPSVVLKEKYNRGFANGYFNLWKRIEEQNIKDCDKIICVDKYVVDDLSSRGLTDKIEFIPNGIDLKKFSPLNKLKARKIVQNKFGQIFSDSITFLYSNRLSKEKGIDDVLELSKSKLDFKIIISGSGPFESEVKEICDKDNRFIFIGSVGNEAVSVLMNSCDFVLTPLHHPGATRTNIEAIATNTPVITTLLHNRYPVINGKNGIVYNSSKSLTSVIESVIKSEPQYNSFSFNAKKDFDLKKISSKIYKVYKELLY